MERDQSTPLPDILLDVVGDDNSEDAMMEAADELERFADVSTPPSVSGDVLPSITETQIPQNAESGKSRSKAKKPTVPKVKAKPRAKGGRGGKAPTKSRVSQLKAEPSVARARSVSETPSQSAAEAESSPTVDEQTMEEEAEENEEEEAEELDLRRYCFCQKLYDHGVVMVCCDRCEDWYHPACVGLKDEDVALIDKYFCPRCTLLDSKLNLNGPRCARPTCPNAARAPISRYCSEICGIRAVMARVDAWNGEVDRLLEHPSVAYARKREGILVEQTESLHSVESRSRPHDNDADEELRHQLRLMRAELQEITKDRETKTRTSDALQGRTSLLKKAIKMVGEGLCGFDPRLILDEDAWAEWMHNGGKDIVYDSFGSGRPNDEVGEAARCRGKRKCERHAGWEVLKAADFELETRVLDLSLKTLRDRERGLRRELEDLEVYIESRVITAKAQQARIASTNIQVA